MFNLAEFVPGAGLQCLDIVRLGPLEVLDGGRGQARQRCVFVLLAEPQQGVHIAARLTMLQAVGQRLGDDGVAAQGDAPLDDECEADHRGDSE